ncbi:MAG: hypothetical protein MJZ33_00875 [Paludibacteraceae bacterium]|nr:hypothetical protein [Paludibacteraceae bacterium]
MQRLTKNDHFQTLRGLSEPSIVQINSKTLKFQPNRKQDELKRHIRPRKNIEKMLQDYVL